MKNKYISIARVASVGIILLVSINFRWERDSFTRFLFLGNQIVHADFVGGGEIGGGGAFGDGGGPTCGPGDAGGGGCPGAGGDAGSGDGGGIGGPGSGGDISSGGCVVNYDSPCSASNSCGQSNNGTIDCYGVCSAIPPSDESCSTPMDCTPRCGECDQPFEGQIPSPGYMICVGSACNYYDHPCLTPPPPICTPSCTECSAVCGWGTKSCTDENCITQNGITCNTQACVCTGTLNNADNPCPGATDLTGFTDNKPKKQVDGTGGCTGDKCEYYCNNPAAKAQYNCQPPVDGACANIGNKTYCQKPSNNDICDDGTPSDPVANGNNWEWKCEGMFGGDDSLEICKALKSCAFREVVPN